jgi:hypothetical protein
MTETSEITGPTANQCANALLGVLFEHGPLDLSQIMIETLLTREQVIQARDLNIKAGNVEERTEEYARDNRYTSEVLNDPLNRIYGIKRPFSRKK